MQRGRWTPKHIVFAACFLLIIFAWFSTGYDNYELDSVIKNAKPEDVWSYVADFSKMSKLNPNILNFRIISDAGNAHDWRYSVEYAERLIHWPFWLSVARSDYIVTKTMPDIKPELFKIKSKHRTCFFKGFYCLNSISEFKFSALGSDTYCSEKIQFECIPFLGEACRRELDYQRKAVMANLTIIFNKFHPH